MTRVQWDATLDDQVDAILRFLARSRSARFWRWAGTVAWMAVCGLATGVAAFLATPVLVPQWQDDRLAVAVACAAGGAVLYPFLHLLLGQRVDKWRIRQHYREVLGSDAPFSVEVELSPSGVSHKQKIGQLSFEWSQVEAIEETADTIEFYARGGMILVRKRAFGSEAEMQHFIEEAESYRTQAQNTEEAEHGGPPYSV